MTIEEILNRIGLRRDMYHMAQKLKYTTAEQKRVLLAQEMALGEIIDEIYYTIDMELIEMEKGRG